MYTYQGKPAESQTTHAANNIKAIKLQRPPQYRIKANKINRKKSTKKEQINNLKTKMKRTK